jgi:hypothetical protein
MQYTQSEYDNSIIVFLLRVDFLGVEHRFSSIPISYEGRDYIGSLSNVDYIETTNLVGFSAETNSVSLSCYFDGLDLLHEYRKGRTLEGQEATVSYILVRNGDPIGDEVLLLKGKVQEPIIGDPEEPSSFAAFTVEQKTIDLQIPLIAQNDIIEKNTFPNADEETAHGKAYPIIIGSPGITREEATEITLHVSPSYNIKKYDVGSPAHDIYFLIAGHETEATTASISDGSSTPITKTIERAVDPNNNEYVYIDMTGEHSFLYPANTSLSSHAEHPKEFFVYLTNGGGIRSPYREGTLEGGADIIRWSLSRGGNVDIDDAAFGNISEILNQYKFSGFINDPSTTADKFLEEHILPFLPVEIQSGPRGLRPILAQHIAIETLQPVMSIVQNETFQRISPLNTTTDTSQIYNCVRMNFAYNTRSSSFYHSLYMGVDAENTQMSSNHLYSDSSANRYGKSVQTFDAYYIYDNATAHRVAADLIRNNAFPKRTIDFAADQEYGVLQIGDIVLLSSTQLYMEEQFCTVVSKSWNTTHWIISLMFEDNPHLMERAT